MNNKISLILQIFLFAFPWRIRRKVLCYFLRYEVDATAKIGYSIILGDKITMAPGSYIGNLTIIKGMTEVYLGIGARLGNLNWITGTSPSGRHFANHPMRASRLLIGHHSAVTHRHLIDCSDEVRIGAFSTVAGWGSQILTHQIDISTSSQTAAPVSIGDYCFVGTRSVLVKGACVPNYAVLAAGSVYTARTNDEYALYGGVPAKKIKDLAPDSGYFIRTEGYVN